MRLHCFFIIITFFFSVGVSRAQPSSFDSFYVDNEGVKIHCVTKGSGPVILFLHGFPDFWFTWIYQMEKFAEEGYTTVGMDLRGYNLSGKPSEVNDYSMNALISDVLSVLNEVSPNEKVILVANDWGGAIAWQVATHWPQKVKYLVACNIPHPASLFRHLSTNPETASYTKKLIADDALNVFSTDKLLEMANVEDDKMMKWYIDAFENSSIESMLNYYKVSYPKPSSGNSSIKTSVKRLKCSVLMIHGLKDKAFPPPVLNDHWEYTEENFTLFTIPEAGHFVQRDAPESVFRIMNNWLKNIDSI